MSFSAIQSFSGSVGTTATTVTFGDSTANVPIRYAYVLIENTSTTAANILYVTTNGVAATSTPGDFTIEIAAGSSVLMANALPWWSQAANVIQKAANPVTSYGTPTEPSTLGYSVYGQKASPGTSISIVCAVTGPGTFTVTGTG